MVEDKLFCGYQSRTVNGILASFRYLHTTASLSSPPLHSFNQWYPPSPHLLPRMPKCFWFRAGAVFHRLSNLTQCLSQSCIRRCISTARVSAAPLIPEIREGLLRLKVSRFTEVQRRCLIPLLQGCSLAVVAEPGAGKTFAYLVPVMQRIVVERMGNFHAKDDDGVYSPFAVVLVPSRELARQVASVAMALVPQVPVLLLDPSTPLQQQEEQLLHEQGELIVTTPDRFNLLLCSKRKRRSHCTGESPNIREKGFSLRNLRVLVVDEADLLLQKGYMTKIQSIAVSNRGSQQDRSTATISQSSSVSSSARISSANKHLQLLFFCAVMPPELRREFLESWYKVQILDLLAKHGESGNITHSKERLSEDTGISPSQLSAHTAGNDMTRFTLKCMS